MHPWLICYQFPVKSYCCVLSYEVLWVSCLSFFVVCVSAWCLVWNPVTQMPSSLTPRIHTFTLHGCWHFTAAWTMWWADRVWGGSWVLLMEQLSILLRFCFNIFLQLVFHFLCADIVDIFVYAKYAYLTRSFIAYFTCSISVCISSNMVALSSCKLSLSHSPRSSSLAVGLPIH